MKKRKLIQSDQNGFDSWSSNKISIWIEIKLETETFSILNLEHFKETGTSVREATWSNLIKLSRIRTPDSGVNEWNLRLVDLVGH